MPNEATSRAGEAVGDLATYERHKHEIAQILREVHAGAYQAKNLGLEHSVGELTNKLAGDRFYLTVVGQFSRGKSTLMNAILGKEYLPSGFVPTTSAITAVSYGSREKVVLRRSDTNLTSEIGIRDLADFVTERINPGNRERIEMAEVQVPVDILQRGFFLVDTPGLGSAVKENTATTLNFLPSADGIVFVTSCDAPLTAGELGYLRECRSSVRKLFLVVNKMDLVPETERGEVLEYAKSKAQEELGETEVHLYAVSARDALSARLSADTAKLQNSGLPELEGAIVGYLTANKQGDFLLQICDRASELLLANSILESQALLARVASLRKVIESGSNREGGEPGRRRSYATWTKQDSSVLRVSCAVCNRVVDAVLDFFRTYQYDLYVSADVQRAHAEAGGFCPMHTWQYANLASPQGICGAYPQILYRFSEDLRDLAEGRAPKHTNGGVAGPPLPADQSCPACRRAKESEGNAVREMAEGLETSSDDKGKADKRLCLTHLEDVVLALHNSSAGKILLERESETLRRVAENLQRYALKHEGRRSDLITEEEWQAPKQALTLLVGHRNVQPRFGR
ncbi:MAG TPA: dynamin family protein [Candidatus Acidoferrales bacterium]|nr:dynamin family protein [Candidatus Acidoferrales bacterium]